MYLSLKRFWKMCCVRLYVCLYHFNNLNSVEIIMVIMTTTTTTTEKSYCTIALRELFVMMMLMMTQQVIINVQGCSILLHYQYDVLVLLLFLPLLKKKTHTHTRTHSLSFLIFPQSLEIYVELTHCRKQKKKKIVAAG